MTDIAALNSRFKLAGHLSLKEKAAGFIVAEVENAHSTATIALQGAHVVTWTPKNNQPVVWVSNAAKYATGKSIRGGAPICWPWFGAHATQASYPGHGYARTVPWELLNTEALSNGSTRLVFRLIESEATHKQWPHATPVECYITVGKSLEIELVTRNITSVAISITEALHTYFQVGDVRQTKVLGLENCSYLDKVDNLNRKKQDGAISISSEVDRVYVNTQSDCIIDDAALKRRIRIQKRGSNSTIVWNPWIEKAEKMGDLGENGYLQMLCVESGNADENVVTIQPGAEHRLWVNYSVES